MKRWMICILLAVGWLLRVTGCMAEASGITLKLTPTTRISFTNAIPHYVYFDAEAENAEKLVIKLYKPNGNLAAYRTRKHVDQNKKAVRQTQVQLRKGETKKEGLNILFRSEIDTGIWRIEVTASAKKKESVTEVIEVDVQVPAPLELGQLEEVHNLLIGEEGNDPVEAEAGKIRFVAQNPKDATFTKEYWLSKKYDLRDTANAKCSRAVFSMALSYLGIDCTPVRVSELLWGEDVFYNFDPVCEKLGNVERLHGDLETLWEGYESGRASPVLLHFIYEGGEGMHALLLVSRDRLNPELFYAVTSSTPINTSLYPGGRWRDHVIPILIEDGIIGARIQSPMLDEYNKARIDEIWQWIRTDIPEADPD